MPLYEFDCKYCRHIFEALCSLGTDEESCPVCGKVSLKVTSIPTFYLRWAPAPYDVKNTFEGSGLEGVEGPDPSKDYEPKKLFFGL